MNGLIIKKKWLNLILDGKKTWEIRGSATKKRERIYLIQSGTDCILGEVDLIDCIGPLSKKELLSNLRKHRIDESVVKRGVRYKKPHAWVFKNIKKYKKPKVYKKKQGPVIWVKVD